MRCINATIVEIKDAVEATYDVSEKGKGQNEYCNWRNL